MRRARLALVGLVAVALAGCSSGGDGGGGRTEGGELTVVVSAPLTGSPWIGRFVERGARLAVEQVNAGGGVDMGGTRRRLRLQVLDHAGSAQRAVANARTAVDADAVALLTDGVGATAVAAVTGPAALPTFVVYEGGEGLVDPGRRPTLFRMAPANRPMSIRLADYLAGSAPRVGLVTDDSGYGRDGRAAMVAALRRDEIPVRADVVVPAGGGDVSPAVARARRSGATALVVWAGSRVVADVVRTARASGWTAPVYAGPSAEDPLVRQQLADRRDWVDGLTFVSWRITSEVGPEPFTRYRTAFERRFGAERIGVTDGGRPVVMPPDWSMYPYDAVQLLAAALAKAGGGGRPLMAALDTVVITGANGDERGFSPTDREGVSSEDMYIARFAGFRFAPVRDDALSQSLPAVAQ